MEGITITTSSSSSSSSSSSAHAMFFFAISFMIVFLTTAAAGLQIGYAAVPRYCIGSPVTGAANYPKYVKHVLAELARVAPSTTPYMQAVAVYPNDAPGSVQGTASCDGTTDASRCKSCLAGLQKLLVDSCSRYEGGGATGGMNICKMAFGIGP